MSRATSKALLMKSLPRRRHRAARPIPTALSSRLRISVRYALIVASTKCASIGIPTPLLTPHMLPAPPKSSETTAIMLLISRDSEHQHLAKGIF